MPVELWVLDRLYISDTACTLVMWKGCGGGSISFSDVYAARGINGSVNVARHEVNTNP
jgi:hypothetical protein